MTTVTASCSPDTHFDHRLPKIAFLGVSSSRASKAHSQIERTNRRAGHLHYKPRSDGSRFFFDFEIISITSQKIPQYYARFQLFIPTNILGKILGRYYGWAAPLMYIYILTYFPLHIGRFHQYE